MKAVNLIPTAHRAAAGPAVGVAASPAPSGGALGAYVLLGVLAFAIAATTLYVLATNSVKSNRAELVQAEQEAEGVERQASALQSFADFKALADTRVSTVSALADARFPWAQTLDDVSRALPSDVYISLFDGGTTSETGGSGLRGAIQAPSIELTGCTSDQTSVARLMSALRDVRGVTRVTLAKSEAVDAVPTTPAPTTAAPGTDQPDFTTVACPSGSPPTFDVIAHFERAALSANAAPNATTAVAAPAPGATVGPTGPAGAATTSATTPTATTP